jgi:hypothetical protein
MNTTTTKQYSEIKNKTVAVVSFSVTGIQVRTSMYGGVGYVKAIQEVQSKQRRGEICMIVESDIFQAITKYERENNVARISLSVVMGMVCGIFRGGMN